MSQIALVVGFDVKAEHFAAFETVIRGHAQRTLKGEEGCMRFDVLIPTDKPNHIFLYEVYRDKAAFDVHVASPLLAKTRESYADMINNRNITVCELSG